MKVKRIPIGPRHRVCPPPRGEWGKCRKRHWKLVKLLFPDRGGIDCSAWDNRTFLQQTMPCSRLHA
eukprot:1014452-Pelagomonas_calceolata.AAC.1